MMRSPCTAPLATLSIREAPQQLTLALNSSPQGRIFQVEYAQEAVKQGSVVVGLVNKTHVVLVGLKVRRHCSE